MLCFKIQNPLCQKGHLGKFLLCNVLLMDFITVKFSSQKKRKFSHSHSGIITTTTYEFFSLTNALAQGRQT